MLLFHKPIQATNLLVGNAKQGGILFLMILEYIYVEKALEKYVKKNP